MPLTDDQRARLAVFLGTVDATSDARDADGAAYLTALGVPADTAVELFGVLRVAYGAGLRSADQDGSAAGIAPPADPDVAAMWEAGRAQAISDQRVARLVGGSVLVAALIGLAVMIVVLLVRWL